MRILHLSDLHLPAAVGVDAAAVLAGLLAGCRDLPPLDAVVVSGDVTDDGSVAGYRLAAELVGGHARERGVPVLFATGNHDAREPFAAVLGSGHLGVDGDDVGRPLLPGSPLRAAVSSVGATRFVTLDSLLPGEVPGRLGEEQRRALRDELATPSPGGTVLVLHHPPVAPDRAPQRTVGLQDAAELADVVAGSDVRLVLCGHFHAPVLGQLAGVPVWAGPGVVTRIHLDVPSGHDVAVRGAGATVVELDGPASPLLWTLQARDPRAGEPVYAVDTTTGRDLPDDGAPQPAHDDDAPALLALREAAAAWLAARGVRQWESGEVSLAEVRAQVARGEWHVVRRRTRPVAALRLLWSDPQTWGEQPEVAAYVHGLVVDREHGAGLGRGLLDWAGARAAAGGRSLLRLDCGEENTALRAYYAGQGFREVGRRPQRGAWYAVTLLERSAG